MARHGERRVTRLRVHCPVSATTLPRLAAGEPAPAGDPVLAAMLAIVRADNPVGDFGAYRGVVELLPGWEMFTPGPDARPTLGSAASETLSPTVILTLHIPAEAGAEAIDAAIAAILMAHPWEVPVIERDECRLVTRAPAEAERH